MRTTIERIPNLNDLVDSVPEEIVRQIQEESRAEEESASESTTMSNDKKTSKSKRIRDYIDAHPNDAPKNVVAALSQYGVTPSDVGNVRSKLKGSKPAKRANAKPSHSATPRASSTQSEAPVPGGINLKALEYGTLFLKEAGSMKSANELLIVIDRIRSA